MNFDEDPLLLLPSYVYLSEAAIEAVLSEKVFLEISQNLQENTCARASFLIKLQASLKKETLALVLSCEFCEISKNTFFAEHIRVTASYLSSRFLMSIAI